MLARALSLALIGWILGFLWFAVALPQPVGAGRADGVVVLTGGSGRVARGLEVLERGWAERMFVSGVDRDVKPHEFAIEYKVNSARMACCVTLGFQATDTMSNADETAAWVKGQRIRTLRVVTNDWHMRRALLELGQTLPPDVALIADAVPTRPSLRTLFTEYHKLLARLLTRGWRG
ncbi:YdcF family protein [Novosphingobium sp.]|uniref:YdcF family protein n=1 Tax=Novosphingobium sp. TaxID=1874826 RepID=UPI0027334B40|nr:YdcF family protein [Novosphingobium sp.]MDP3908476.1 YdcF family protein [Novosphingobium sp.]